LVSDNDSVSVILNYQLICFTVSRKIKMVTHNDSSSDSDDDLAKLREAVDCDTLKDNLYSNKIGVENSIVADENSLDDSSTVLKPPHDSSLDSKSLGAFIKSIIETSKTKQKPVTTDRSVPSLRREKHGNDQPTVVSELEVTPQFQRFVGKKLDEFLENHIEDILKDSEETALNHESEIKLLKRSKVSIQEEIEDNTKRLRPELLAHRTIVPNYEDLTSCAVTGGYVLSQVEVAGWANKFPDRVEEGIERIKKKKKKVKKKKVKADLIKQ